MSGGKFQRVIFLVLDSVGAGEMPDAAAYGDTGANTLGHIARAVGGLKLPTLAQMGLGNLTKIKGVEPNWKATAAFGRAAELSRGKDTTTGHWEFAGIHTRDPFATFPEGFPDDFIQKFIRDAKVPGVLGNKAASGTAIIDELGEEHMNSGKPIVYTSADSVFQIACHEETYELKRLYKFCEIARKLCDPLNVSRVIARPFTGRPGTFKRTSGRKDFSIQLPERTMIDMLAGTGLETISVGKVASIYNYQGFTREISAAGNREIMDCVLRETSKRFHGLLFANLVDFDMLYGHRRDVAGYAKELEWFDSRLPELLGQLKDDDLLVLSADHGNDPTAEGSDHTREYVPVLAWTKRTAAGLGKDLGIRESFADIGQTILEALGARERLRIGQSFLGELA